MARGLPPTTLTAVPLFHVSGLHAQLLSALRNGRRLVFIHRWEPATALALIAAEKITQFNGAPSMVLQLLAEGRSNKEVATLLDLGLSTVETHRAHLFAKLEVGSLAQLIRGYASLVEQED